MQVETKSGEFKTLSDAGVGEAVIITKHVIDRDGDVTDDGAVGEQDAVLLLAHKWDSVPLGKGRTFETPGEVRFRFQVNLDLEEGQKLLSYLKWDTSHGKPLSEWSYGFRVKEGGSRREVKDGRSVRVLQPVPGTGEAGVEVIEASVVVKGAGVGTRTVAAKDDQARHEHERLLAIIQAQRDTMGVYEKIQAEQRRQLEGKTALERKFLEAQILAKQNHQKWDEVLGKRRGR
jgi:hypothetical protein